MSNKKNNSLSNVGTPLNGKSEIEKNLSELGLKLEKAIADRERENARIQQADGQKEVVDRYDPTVKNKKKSVQGKERKKSTIGKKDSEKTERVETPEPEEKAAEPKEEMIAEPSEPKDSYKPAEIETPIPPSKERTASPRVTEEDILAAEALLKQIEDFEGDSVEILERPNTDDIAKDRTISIPKVEGSQNRKIGANITEEEAKLLEEAGVHGTLIIKTRIVDINGNPVSGSEAKTQGNERKEVKYPTLTVHETGEIVNIDQTSFYIGAEPSCDFYFNVRYVSRNHAVIIKKPDGYYLSDQGSRNGTYLNGKKLAAGHEAKLNSGDRLKLANQDLTFKL